MDRPPQSPIVAKKQCDPQGFRQHCSFFESARDGFEAALRSRELANKTVLLPAYIGISTREGSGVFDPILRTQARFQFYRLDPQLNICGDELKAQIRRNRGQILLLIHYFGFKDKNLEQLKDFARRHEMIIVEDFAHAFFTFWQEPVLDFNYGLFSIHKMFPCERGGFVLSKKPFGKGSQDGWNPLTFDMEGIIQRRLENYRHLLRLIGKLKLPLRILRPRVNSGVPQTFPILLRDRTVRDACYFELNARGFGVVSLYHSLIPAISESYREERNVADRILNLPVHQDADVDALSILVDELKNLLAPRRSKTKRS